MKHIAPGRAQSQPIAPAAINPAGLEPRSDHLDQNRDPAELGTTPPDLILRTASQAAKLRLFCRRPDSSTIWRWMTRGIGGVRLRSVAVGRSLMTTERWLNEFFAALGQLRQGGRA